MDAAGLAATLVVLAAHVANKIVAFNKRIKERQTLLNGMIEPCESVRLIATLIEAQLKAQHVQPISLADHDEDPWHLLALTLEAMKRLLLDFDKELEDLKRKTATTRLGRAILQLKTDDTIPRILQIQEQIHQKHDALSIIIPFALHCGPSLTPSLPLQLPSPPPTPNIPCRRPSEISTLSAYPISDIERATRNLDIRMVKQLLDHDTTGELINTKDSAGRTLIDIAICHGRPTSSSQVPMVKLLGERGVRFTLAANKSHRKTYGNIVETINYQNRTKRSSFNVEKGSNPFVVEDEPPSLPLCYQSLDFSGQLFRTIDAISL